MSYAGISVREAMEKLNATNNGWFLPQVQRQYVWGARHESESYVCLLLDSLLKRYPIGGVVLWETSQSVPYREFVKDYAPGLFAKQVEKGRWGADKCLVYDGQQRLQTLYSVLFHRFNGRVLHFDLMFDDDRAESDETGFLFRNADTDPEDRYLSMTRLVSLRCNQDQKVILEEDACDGLKADKKQRLIIRRNVGNLWDTFVDNNIKSIAYFSVKADTPKEVNEVFRRLNTGGVALTQLELVLGKIKAVKSDYEEELWKLSDTIREKSGGIEFKSADILQFFHLLIKETIRIDENRLDFNDIKLFQQALTTDSAPLVEMFQGYLSGLLNINHVSIIPRWLATLPIAAYLASRKRSNHKWRIRHFSSDELQAMHKYFILSQFCDWNTQTMVNAFTRLAVEAGLQGVAFPIKSIRDVAVEKNRTGKLYRYQFLSYPWLATKILMPLRKYVFHENKPQVDHIFPLKLAGMDDRYRDCVDVLWNLQPVSAEINNYKRARHPKEFFNSDDGSKYYGDYDFLPKSNSMLWDDHDKFVKYREGVMRSHLHSRYGLKLYKDSDADASDS